MPSQIRLLKIIIRDTTYCFITHKVSDYRLKYKKYSFPQKIFPLTTRLPEIASATTVPTI